MRIKNYFEKIIRLRILFLVCRFVITTINVIIGFFVLSMLIDKIFPLPIIIFHIYWFIILGAIFIFFINLIVRIVELKIRPYYYVKESINKYINFENKDDIINAFLLEQNLVSDKNLNFSFELANEFVKKVKGKLLKIKPQKIIEFEKILKVLPLNFVLIFLVFILYVFPPYVIKESIYKILFTRNPEILGIFVSPKNIKIPYKESCEIKVIIDKNYEVYTPTLFIKTKNYDKFVKINFDSKESFLNRKVYKYKINSVEEKIFYKIKFRGVKTKTFIIEPILYPEISEIKISVFPPEYTGIKPYEVNSFNATKYFYNTNIKFTGTTNKEVKDVNLLFSDGKKIILSLDKDKTNFYGEFKVTRNTELWFEITDVENMNNFERLRYKINILEDKHPEIELVSPQNEIVVEPDVKIPLVFSCRDDISLKRVELEYYVNNNLNNKIKIKIKEYVQKTKEDLTEYIFDLSKLKINFGDVINYYLIVYDNNPYRNQYNVSFVQKIEIFSYERQHKYIQKQIEELNKKSLDLLSKEIELKEFFLTKTTTTVNFDDDLQKFIISHLKTKEDFDNLKKIISSIVENMSKDPYTSFNTYIEFKNIESLIKGLKEEIFPQLVDELKNKNLSKAEGLQQQIIDSLERITELSQEIVKKQNMQNIVEITKNVKSFSEDIFGILKNSGKNLSEEEKNKIKNLLKEIEDKLKKINDLIKNMPQNLPTDFVNQRDIQNLDLFTPTDLIQKIISAIEQNDFSLATILAKNLLSQLDYITQKFLQSSNTIVSSETSYLNKELQELISNLDKIIFEEDEIYKNTKKIENYKITEILKQQEATKSIIKNNINKIKYEINDILNMDEFDQFLNKNLYKQNSLKIINNLDTILSEIERNVFLKTAQLVEDSKDIWEDNFELIKDLDIERYKVFIEKTEGIKEKIDELYKIINLEPEIKYEDEILQQNKELINKQEFVINETKNFRDKLKSLGKKSFIISYEDILITNQSINSMNNSKEFLERKNFSFALQEQNSAINLLLELRNKFNDKQSMIKQMLNSFSKPMAERMQYKSSAGKFGILEGRVLLPSVKDYEPPKELREEIIKSLSEKYPKELENVLQKYYQEILR